MSFGNTRNYAPRNASTTLPLRRPWSFEYFVTGEKTPKLTSRIIDVKRTQLVEVTESAPFGPTTKKTWRTESEAAIEETFE